MLQIVQSTCPKCNKKANGLLFWKKVNDDYFHICKDCLDTPTDIADALRIGLYYGKRKAKEELREFLAL